MSVTWTKGLPPGRGAWWIVVSGVVGLAFVDITGPAAIWILRLGARYHSAVMPGAISHHAPLNPPEGPLHG